MDRREECGRWQSHSRLAKEPMSLCSKNGAQCRERIMSGKKGRTNGKLSMSVINMDVCLPRGPRLFSAT